ncbi:hypothetical protein G6011_06204 [Alternaria panax]|uniref:N-acetyltransferase domain-containing protein n=1 Tax=Alternaria panax TaxID=48097 RepID=A0AAD4FGQ7_9PLEO|nr:hypothetical protein G6011_06204 [Alternaria panax]
MEAKQPGKKMTVWRPLSVSDIPSLVQVADRVHPDLPESNKVFAERTKLFPQGCLGVFDGLGELRGYIISHPIRYREPPALDQLLGEVAPDADQYYIHDLAILPEFRGSGLAHECLSKILETVAKRYATTSLVSVYGTEDFWGRYGFMIPGIVDEVLEKKLVGYGDDAVYLEQQVEGEEQGLGQSEEAIKTRENEIVVAHMDPVDAREVQEDKAAQWKHNVLRLGTLYPSYAQDH